MKVMKWICRYSFFGLLLIGGGLWCGYCGWTVNRLEAQMADASFIDLALKSVADAQEVLDRTERFRGYLETGIWFCVAVLGLLALLIVSQVYMKKRASRPKPEKKPAAESTAEAVAAEVKPETTMDAPAKDGVSEGMPALEMVPETVQPDVSAPEIVPETVQPDESAPEVVPVAVQPETPERMLFCTECGRPYREGAKFCTGCGKKLD